MRDGDGAAVRGSAAARRDEVVAARQRVPLGEGARQGLAQLARLRSCARPPPAAAARPAADLVRREGVRRPVRQQDFAGEFSAKSALSEAESAATNQDAAPPASRSASWAQFTTPRTSSMLIPDERVPCISSSGRVRLPLSTRRNFGHEARARVDADHGTLLLRGFELRQQRCDGLFVRLDMRPC